MRTALASQTFAARARSGCRCSRRRSTTAHPLRRGAQSSRARASSRERRTWRCTSAVSSTSSNSSRGRIAPRSMSVRTGVVLGIPSTMVQSPGGSSSVVCTTASSRVRSARGAMTSGLTGGATRPSSAPAERPDATPPVSRATAMVDCRQSTGRETADRYTRGATSSHTPRSTRRAIVERAKPCSMPCCKLKTPCCRRASARSRSSRDTSTPSGPRTGEARRSSRGGATSNSDVDDDTRSSPHAGKCAQIWHIQGSTAIRRQG